jgi:serine/threonine-protein kinase
MEYVEGDDLDAWAREAAREHGRRWREILEVYVAAGRGLEAAHRAGLVHRDFKPSNVLVGRDGRARVLDFGLARDFMTERRSAARPDSKTPRPHAAALEIAGHAAADPLTLAGRLVGTPAYMAPEQHRGEPADERSDQFAFCVALWEALFGVRPFPGKEIGELASAKAAGVIVPPGRGTGVPAAIAPALLRGLQADPSLRFRDMGALLEALTAIPRRRRNLAIAGVAALGLGLLAIPAAWSGGMGPCREAASAGESVWNPDLRAEVEARFAGSTRAFVPASAHAVVEGLDAYVGEWAARRQEACESALLRDESDREAMARTAQCLDHHLARAAEVVGLVREADDELMVRAIDAVDGLPVLGTCDAADPTQVTTDADRELLHRLDRAYALAEAAQHEDAIAVADGVRQDAERGGGTVVVAHALLVIGRMHVQSGRWPDGRRHLHEALAAAERAGDEATAVSALLALAGGLIDGAEPEWAERLLEVASAKLDHHALGDALRYEHMHQRVRLLRFQGRPHDAVDAAERALALAERHFPEGHLSRARAHTTLGTMFVDRGDVEPAREQYLAARAIIEARLGPAHPYVADSLANEALLEDQAGRYEVGLELHLRALELREQAYGPDHPQVGYSCANLSTTYERLGRIEPSLAMARRAQRIFTVAHGERHPHVGAIMGNLANTLLDAGAYDEALATAHEAVSIVEATLGPRHPRFAVTLGTEGIALAEIGRYREAIARLDRARTILETEMGARDPTLPLLYKAMAEAELADGQRDRAKLHLERALGLFSDGSHDPVDIAKTQLLLARVLRATDPVRAGALTETARTQWLASGRTAEAFAAASEWLPGVRNER